MFPFAEAPDELPQAALLEHCLHSALEQHIMPSSVGGGPSLWNLCTMETPTCICFRTIVRGWEEEKEIRYEKKWAKAVSDWVFLSKYQRTIKNNWLSSTRPVLCRVSKLHGDKDNLHRSWSHWVPTINKSLNLLANLELRIRCPSALCGWHLCFSSNLNFSVSFLRKAGCQQWPFYHLLCLEFTLQVPDS